MDRKRQRHSPIGGDEKRTKSEESESVASREHRLRSNHPEVVLSALNSCKSKIVSKSAVEAFVRSDMEQFSAILDVFKRAALSEIDADSPWSAILKKTSSILATCCYFSFTACVELARPRRNIPQTLGRLLEMNESRIPLSTKASLLRLIKNLCRHKEIAASMTYFTLDCIVQFLNHKDRNVGYNALGIVCALVNLNFASRVISANGCKYLGDLLSREEKITGESSWSQQILNIFKRLVPNSASTARTIGRQVAMSEGGAALLSTFLKEGCEEEFSNMVVKICTHSSHIREYFCDHGILEKIVSMEQPSTSMISILCAYTKEAWSREKLLNVGALDVMLTRFCESSIGSERLMIVSSLIHFFHYVGGLVHIFRNTALLKTIVADISKYLSNANARCKHKYSAHELLPCDTAVLEQRAALRLLIYSTVNKDRINSSFVGKYYTKQFDSTFGGNISPVLSWSRSVSPPSNSLGSWCGAVSPPSADSMSPPSVISPSSSVEDFFSLLSARDTAEEIVDMEKMEVEEDKKESLEEASKERFTMQRIVSAELQLFAYPTSENNILGILIKEEVIDVLLRSCSEVTLSETNPVKILLRILEYRTMMDKLLAMQVHSRIFHLLMTKKWDMEGHTRALSAHCSSCTTLGYMLLKEFSTHVDSNFGLPILVDALKAKSAGERIKASIATLYLVRSQTGQMRIYSKFDPVRILVDALREIFSDSENKDCFSAQAYENGPSLLYQILCSLSAVVNPTRLCSLFSFTNEAYNFIMVGGFCKVHEESASGEGETGMFGNEFLEKTTRCDTFLFSEDVEGCSEEEFKQFLHYLCGCRSEKCFKIESAHPVVVMIRLADRYLCTSMTDMLLAENGPAIYYTLKGNVEEFLSPLLFTGIGECERFEDAFFLQLLRFSTDEQIQATLKPLIANFTATEVFIEKLSKFLQRHILSNVFFNANSS